MLSKGYLRPLPEINAIQKVDWISGAAIFTSKKTFNQLGGFDEDYFMYCEDVDFCLRARKAGQRVIYHPSASVIHAIGGSSRQLPFKMILERHRSIWNYYRKHMRISAWMDPLILGGLTIRCIGIWVITGFRSLLR